MPNASDLTEAIGFALENLQEKSDIGDLQSCIAAFNGEWIATFSPTNVAERTVLNWIIPLRAQQTTLPATGTLGEISGAGDALTRMLFATAAADDAGRISSAQVTAVLDAYNTNIAVP